MSQPPPFALLARSPEHTKHEPARRWQLRPLGLALQRDFPVLAGLRLWGLTVVLAGAEAVRAAARLGAVVAVGHCMRREPGRWRSQLHRCEGAARQCLLRGLRSTRLPHAWGQP